MKLTKEQLLAVFESKNYEKFSLIYPQNVVNALFIKYTKYTNSKNSIDKNLKEDDISFDFIDFIDFDNADRVVKMVYKGNYLIEDENKYLFNLYENFGLHKKYSTEELSIINKILVQLKTIDNALEPIKSKLNMDYEISLTGGAIRDFLTGNSNSISDLDILINIPFPTECILDNAKIKIGDIQEEKFENYYNELEPSLKTINLDHLRQEHKINSSSQLQYFIIQALIERNLPIDKKYTPYNKSNVKDASKIINIKEESYVHNFLQGVIKLTKKENDYPIDLLISNTNIDCYNAGFDFNICKTYLNYTLLPKKIKQSIMPDMNVSHIVETIQLINLNDEFLTDVLNKRLTLNFISYTINQINASLTKHYPKIQDKYEDYKLYLEYNAFNNILITDKCNYIFNYTKIKDEIKQSHLKDLKSYSKLNENFMFLKSEDLSSKISEEIKKELMVTLNYLHIERLIPEKVEHKTVMRNKI